MLTGSAKANACVTVSDPDCLRITRCCRVVRMYSPSGEKYECARAGGGNETRVP